MADYDQALDVVAVKVNENVEIRRYNGNKARICVNVATGDGKARWVSISTLAFDRLAEAGDALSGALAKEVEADEKAATEKPVKAAKPRKVSAAQQAMADLAAQVAAQQDLMKAMMEKLAAK